MRREGAPLKDSQLYVKAGLNDAADGLFTSEHSKTLLRPEKSDQTTWYP